MFAVKLPRRMAFASSSKARAFMMPDAISLFQFPPDMDIADYVSYALP